MSGLVVVAGLIILAWLLSKRPSSRSIGEVSPGTILIHKADGTVKEREYGGGTDPYYHEECAADYLCEPEKHSRIEMKDTSGNVYSYTQESLKHEGWL